MAHKIIVNLSPSVLDLFYDEEAGQVVNRDDRELLVGGALSKAFPASVVRVHFRDALPRVAAFTRDPFSGDWFPAASPVQARAEDVVNHALDRATEIAEERAQLFKR